ncbi:hypothetical protein GCM10022381_31770 [Leifsonia kafniensis]|uniref:BMP family ABC transporter substrate-binding protein n=1 Tax=Leifsonia kafniensis TaxID=475957 RepID=A0ABP7KW71_9MICO
MPRNSETRRRTFSVSAASALAIVAFATGCTAGGNLPDGHAARASPSELQQLGAGFLGDTPTPSPEATVNPEPGSWEGVVPPAGYRVVLISAGQDAATATLTTAVTDWASRERVELHTLTAANDEEVEARAIEALATSPDLVIGVGSGVIDVLALVTPQHLAQQFLIVGAELPEPTENVTSAVWKGATFRGTGLSASGDQDAKSVTPKRADEAITAGVASVLSGLTGIVLHLSF